MTCKTHKNVDLIYNLWVFSLLFLCAHDFIDLQKPSDKKVRLSGYGVELAIKNTEYKAKDDSKVEGKR